MNILSDKTVKIRKPRRCLFCETLKEKGEHMHAQVNTYDNHLSTVYWCLPCEEIRKMGKIEEDPWEGIYVNASVRWHMQDAGCKTVEEYLEILKAKK